MEVAQPLACSNASGLHPIWSRHDCTNDETEAPDLVLSKLILELRGHFGPYGRCNVCGTDGIDHMSGLKCQPGEYVCTCPDPHVGA